LKYIRTAILATAAVLLAGVLAQPAHAEVSFDVAYTNLSEHGTWLVSAQYGHVWQPREYTQDWNPYYDGHWVYTDLGWAWVSDYEWGSIPYHYGTWYSDPDAGWVWVPGRTWAPSWVVFRTGPDYIGWAPVPPGFSIGLSLNMGASSSFVFVSSHDFLAPRVRMSVIPRARESVYINNTTVVNNIVVQNNVVINQGPDYRTVEKAIGRPIHTERIETVARVAPYAHVDRAQLALAPGTAQRDVRVAEPVPASQPLPVSNNQGHRGANAPTANAQAPSQVQPVNEQHPPLQTPPPADATPGEAPNTARKGHGAPTPPTQGTTNAQQSAQAEADAKAHAQQSAQEQTNAKTRADHSAKAQATAETKADQSAQSQADAKMKADQSAQEQKNAKAQADQSAQSQANARAHSDQNAQAQANAKAKADQNAHSQAAAKAHADQNAQAQANAKAKADQNAQSQAAAKAHADQNAQAQANAKAHADQNAQAQATAKAKADQSAQANANAKKAADAKAKKHEPVPPPPAKDPNSTEGTTPADKNEKPQ
jgi:Family of unknown function (DUF6600)